MTVPQPPPHRVHALTSSELTGYSRQLEQAITGTPPDVPARANLRRRLEEVLAEQQSRADLAAAAGHAQT